MQSTTMPEDKRSRQEAHESLVAFVETVGGMHEFTKRDKNRLHSVLESIEEPLARAVHELPSEAAVQQLVERITSVLPDSQHPAAHAVGPVFETGDLIAWRGVKRQAIHKQREGLHILAMKTADGVWVYPEWQFDERGAVRAGVGEAVKALTAGRMDAWTQAVWFRGASPDLGNSSAAEWLLAGKDPVAVVQIARRVGHRWRQ